MRHIKKSLLKLAALLFLFSTTHVYAGAYVMPVNTVAHGSSGMADTTMQIVAWTEEEGFPNPCYRKAKCYVGPDVWYKVKVDNSSNRGPSIPNPGMQGSCDYAKVCLENAGKYPTTADVMRAYKQKLGIPKQVTFTIMSADADCIGLFYTTEITGGYDGKARIFPNSTCNKMPPPNQTCEIHVPSEIAYGELIAPEVNNASRTVNGYFKCALPDSKIQLHATSREGEPKVYFDAHRQMYATLQINDKDATHGINVAVKKHNGVTPFTLKSILHTVTPPKAGKYEGTAIVYLTFI
ncbi:Fimbrial adhesin, MrxH [Xenorhabdus beddingii]|uniref:Fimbrial adhesin, MrxH n=1 Tax=Xenorhabdus beddingii TaxID=40578 RepID=A0A1Y2STC9_9GAMM|nr:hypothetical protein [Xenorhabdus beddingii]OTA21461.1 Fimbrial adhesin, MrxH [Xenorhabdus beddingii]